MIIPTHSSNSHTDSPSSDNIICTVGVAKYVYIFNSDPQPALDPRLLTCRLSTIALWIPCFLSTAHIPPHLTVIAFSRYASH